MLTSDIILKLKSITPQKTGPILSDFNIIANNALAIMYCLPLHWKSVHSFAFIVGERDILMLVML